MDDFRKYERLRDRGVPAREIFAAGLADGLGEIAAVRMIRGVCGLSLRQAKDLTDAAQMWDERQEIEVGKKVSWERWTNEGGYSFLEGTVASIHGGIAHIEGVKRYRATGGDLEEVPLAGDELQDLRVSWLERPLSERLGDLLQFVDGLADLGRSKTA